jgi:hypothetical protein
MTFKIAPLLLLSLGLTGCGLYVVKKSTSAGDHHGIPFYVKSAGCKREIIRVKPYYLLTLTTETGEKTSQSESTVMCKENFTSAVFQTLVDEARAGKDITASWKAVKNLPCDVTTEPLMGSKNSFVASDTISNYAYVDYQNTYTLNVRRPVIGSASATTKLATDGTLSEATAQVEDKTLETLIGAIPSADLIKSAAAIAPAVALTPNTYPYELKIEEKAVKFIWTYYDPAMHGGCEKDPLLISDPPTAGKPDLVVQSADGDKKAADDSNTVKVNGSIQLPKAKDATPAGK